MNMKKLVAAAALALMVVGTQAGAETLRVGSETVYPPFEFLDSNSGKYVGFDIDLIDEVAKRAGFEPQILSMGLDGLDVGIHRRGGLRPHDYAGACRQGRLHEAVLSCKSSKDHSKPRNEVDTSLKSPV